MPTTAAALQGHVVVRCGDSAVPVTHVEAIGSLAQGKSDVTIVGTLQSALGGSDWTTNDSRTRMHEVRPGVFELQVSLPPGQYNYKIVRGTGWAENYGAGFAPGGSNLNITVPAGSPPVLLRVDFPRKTIQTSLDTPTLTATPIPTDAPPALSQTFRLVLARPLGPADIIRPMTVQVGDAPARPLYARDALSAPEYVYSGSDLGANYSPAQTTFKVWSPVSSSAEVLLYPDAVSSTSRRVALHRGPAGVWQATVPGNLNGTFYQYRFTSYGTEHIAPDIYGRAADQSLQRSMVVDLARTNPPDWANAHAVALARPTDAVVYELHTRDFTVDPSSGVPAPLRGKYLGLIAPGTHVPGTNQPTGLDYLLHLGITHVQVLPFQSINPQHAGGYNWGYETDLFNVPEPRYATQPSNPSGVIREVKTMIAGLHRAGLGLVMDVVYNHSVPIGGDASPFDAAVPYYYFRTGPQGELLNESGVGNALDDDRPMVRKFVCDSLAYWAKEYKVDGFRFDLLGMFTPATVSALSQTLHAVRPDILLYGEPWTGGGPTRFGKGAQRGLGVAVFNDTFRTAIRGDLNGAVAGFALGGGGAADQAALQSAVSGSPDFTQSPTETINYVSIHDDTALWDKIQKTLPDDPALDKQALNLAGAMTLLSEGVPVLEGGAEMGRTKGGNSNSYNVGDAINHFNWQRGLGFADTTDYYRGLIAVRRAHPAFRCATAARVRETLRFLPASALPPKTIAFVLDGAPTGDTWAKTLVIFHGAIGSDTLTLPPGRWHLAVDSRRAAMHGALWPGATLPLAPLSAYVLYQDAP